MGLDIVLGVGQATAKRQRKGCYLGWKYRKEAASKGLGKAIHLWSDGTFTRLFSEMRQSIENVT